MSEACKQRTKRRSFLFLFWMIIGASPRWKSKIWKWAWLWLVRRLSVSCWFTSGPLSLHVVPGGWAAEAPGREEGARAGGDTEGLWGEQQLHQARKGKAWAEDGGQQGEQGGPAGCHVGEAAGEGTFLVMSFIESGAWRMFSPPHWKC